MYAAFPWDGKAEAAEVPAEGGGEAVPDRPLTMEEMMKKAKENAAAEEAPEPEPGRPLTMEEMMKKAKENVAKDEATP